MGVIIIAMTIMPSGYADISLSNLKSGDKVVQHDQTAQVHISK